MTGWKDIPENAREDLCNWYNCEPEDKKRLARLYHTGRFHAWNCPKCGERVYWGDPEDWGHFQGVRQADYISYPGWPEYFAPRMNSQLCDTCRCHHPFAHLEELELSGTNEPSCWLPDD